LDCSLRSKSKFSAEVGEAGKVTLLKPQTFMNRSGVAVAAIVNWLKLTPVDVLVVVEEAALHPHLKECVGACVSKSSGNRWTME